MLKDFEKYLINKGYKEFTPKGNPSTVYDYSKRIKNICKRENLSVIDLAKNIDSIVKKYDVGGIEEEYGKKSKSAFINALKRFSDFLIWIKG